MNSLAIGLMASMLLVCACAQAQVASQASAPASVGSTAADASASSDPERPDRSCKVDSDCQVKDVGNCCGAYPECVNTNAPVDPAKVRAQCASEHRMGTCHVMATTGCRCEQGQCADINAAQAHRNH